MDEKLAQQVDGLIEKYTELMVGESTPELKEKVKAWALYMHMAKSMPPMVKHWNETYPDAKEGMKELIGEIKELNQQHRQQQNRNE